ncbi:MAG: leucine-rich repeat protein [Lachnospiraceae bacterium]|nr:leucine-rich repeat protein [Lachnospiraceae bacterium]
MQTIGEHAFAIETDSYNKKYLQKIYIDSNVTDIHTFHLDTLQHTIFYVEAGSPLIEYCIENSMPYLITNDPADGVTPAGIGQILSNDTCMVMINGEHTATLLDLSCEEESLCLDEQFDWNYHGHTYTIDTIERMALDDTNCPYLNDLVFGEHITHFKENCCGITSSRLQITLPSHIEEFDLFSFSTLTGRPVVKLPSTMTTLSDTVIGNLCASPYHLLLAENSPLLSRFSSANGGYDTYKVEGYEPATTTEADSAQDSPQPSDTTEEDTTQDTSQPSDTTEDVTAQVVPQPSHTTEEYGQDIPQSSSYSESTKQKGSDRSDDVEPSTTADTGTQKTATHTTPSRPATGTLLTVKKMQYKVTGKKTVTFMKPVKKGITRLTIPATITYQTYTFKVTAVNKNACAKCTKLKKVTIKNNVAQIGDNAFAYCSALTNITFGTGIKTLGKRVLYNDTKLAKITFQSKKIKSIGKQTFHNVPKRVNILVPNAKVATYSKLINSAK